MYQIADMTGALTDGYRSCVPQWIVERASGKTPSKPCAATQKKMVSGMVPLVKIRKVMIVPR